MSHAVEQIGLNNAYKVGRYSKPRPFHEDVNNKDQPFEPSAVRPGQTTRIRVDFKHGAGREVVLNDIMLCFKVKCPTAAGRALVCRGTDLIRELVIKFNNDEVFKVDKQSELSLMWELNTVGKLNLEDARDSTIYVKGNVPKGKGMRLDQMEHLGDNATAAANTVVQAATLPLDEQLDGLPRLIWSDTPSYQYEFAIPLSQLTDGMFHRFHMRRIEYLNIEIMFEPSIDLANSQKFIYFKEQTATDNHWGDTIIEDLKITQYRSTYIGCMPPIVQPHLALTWMNHFYSKREYQVDLTTETSWDIRLNDWEVRKNISRIYWMLAPRTNASGLFTNFTPWHAGPSEPIAGCVLKWKNDEVIELNTTYDVYRHYIHSWNKRTHSGDPHKSFPRILPRNHTDLWYTRTTASPSPTTSHPTADLYDTRIYWVDLNMNTRSDPPGHKIVEGITNDTSDYVLTIKKLDDQEFTLPDQRTLWVWLEYPKGVQLAGGSDFARKESQTVTTYFN